MRTITKLKPETPIITPKKRVAAYARISLETERMSHSLSAQVSYYNDKMTVKSILQNEKFKGDALLQKSYTADFLTKRQVINHGEIPQYYVSDNHKAIIEPEIFDRVQDMMRERNSRRGYSGVTIFSSKSR